MWFHIAKISRIALAVVLSACVVALTTPSATGGEKDGACPCKCGCATSGKCNCAKKDGACPCKCGCATSGKCVCAKKDGACLCKCGCATSGKCNCAKKDGDKKAAAPLKSAS
jgi:hypothetical protein